MAPAQIVKGFALPFAEAHFHQPGLDRRYRAFPSALRPRSRPSPAPAQRTPSPALRGAAGSRQPITPAPSALSGISERPCSRCWRSIRSVHVSKGRAWTCGAATRPRRRRATHRAPCGRASRRRGDVMLFGDEFQRPVAHLAAPRLVAQQAAQRGGKIAGIAGHGQQARDVVSDDGRNAAGSARDHRHARRLRFQQRHAIGLVDRRPDQEIGRRIEIAAAPPAAAGPQSACAPAPRGQQLPRPARAGPSPTTSSCQCDRVSCCSAGPARDRTRSLSPSRIIATVSSHGFPLSIPKRRRQLLRDLIATVGGRGEIGAVDERLQHDARMALGSATPARHSASAGLSVMMASAWPMASGRRRVTDGPRPPARLPAWETSATT